MAIKEDKSPLQVQREEMELELQMLDLEEKREAAALRRSRKAQREQSRASTETSLEDTRLQQKAREGTCPHRKGGKDLEGLYVGSSSDHSIIKHTLPQGGILVVCTRCQKIWERPTKTMIDEDTGEKVTTARYAELVRDYAWALNAPTDNVPSGTRLFDIRATAPAA